MLHIAEIHFDKIKFEDIFYLLFLFFKKTNFSDRQQHADLVNTTTPQKERKKKKDKIFSKN